MRTLSRRTVLGGAAAATVTLAGGIMPTAVASPLPALPPALAAARDPLIALGEHLAAAWERYETENVRVSAIYDALPKYAHGGWPIIDRKLPIFADFPELERAGTAMRDRITLSELRAYNREEQEAAGDHPDDIAACRAECRARVRWWNTYQRKADRARAESGIDAAVSLQEAAGDEFSAAREAIGTMPAVTLAGVIVKLRAVAHDVVADHTYRGVFDAEALEWPETVTLAVLADLERIAGGAS